MKLSHQRRSLDVDRVLVTKRSLLDAHDESKLQDVLREISQPDRFVPAFIQVVELERLEITQQKVPRQLCVLEPGKILQSLGLGRNEAPARALLLDQEQTLPEEINESALFAKQPDGFFEAGYATDRYAEHVKEVLVEELRLALFVPMSGPFVGKTRSTRSNLIPGKSHVRSESLAYSAEREQP